MSRLIDADKLIKAMYVRYDEKVNNVPDNLAEGFMQVDKLIKEQPTAFDVDKVIKELESLVEDREEDIINDEYTFGECSAYESAIRVVKKAGGIDEKN